MAGAWGGGGGGVDGLRRCMDFHGCWKIHNKNMILTFCHVTRGSAPVAISVIRSLPFNPRNFIITTLIVELFYFVIVLNSRRLSHRPEVCVMVTLIV